MKRCFFLFVSTFLLSNLFAQSNLGPSSGFFANKNTGQLVNAINTIDYQVLTFFDKSRIFDNKFDESRRKGSYFLFKKWENSGLVTIGKKKFTLTNINYDIEDDKFMSKMEGDSILVFDSNYVDKVQINDKSFKYYYDSSISKKRNFEVIYEGNNDFSILKGYSLKVILGDPNPMLNRPLDEIKQRSKYYIFKDNQLSELKLQKKSVLSLFEKEMQAEVKKFVSKNGLSYKKERDIARIFKYYEAL